MSDHVDTKYINKCFQNLTSALDKLLSIPQPSRNIGQKTNDTIILILNLTSNNLCSVDADKMANNEQADRSRLYLA